MKVTSRREVIVTILLVLIFLAGLMAQVKIVEANMIIVDPWKYSLHYLIKIEFTKTQQLTYQ